MVLFVGLLSAAPVGSTPARGEAAEELTANHPWIGEDAPSFELQSTEGSSVSLDDFKGRKVVVIHFATSW